MRILAKNFTIKLDIMLTAVISNRSLLLQGIISRLRRSSPKLDVEMVEYGENNVAEKIIELQPDIVIVDSKEFSGQAACPLNVLFAALPRLVVIEVNIETSNIQIIRSSQYAASGVEDLLNILKNADGDLRGVFSSI